MAEPVSPAGDASEASSTIFDNKPRNYILAPSEKRGVLFEYDMFAPPSSCNGSDKDRARGNDSGQNQDQNQNQDQDQNQNQDNDQPLQGFIDVSSKSGPTPALQAIVPSLDQMKKVLEGKVSDSGKVELEQGVAQSDEEKQRSLIAEAFLKHGTLGVLVVATFTGTLEVYQVLRGSPAQYAGLKPGDKIVEVNGRRISAADMKNIYHILTGYRGQSKTLKVQRGINQKTLVVPLWGIYDFRDRRSQYIEYYWYLLYHNLIGPREYERAVKPFLYFKPPTVRPPKKPAGK
ncbi:MAG: PDZ domain-containing protein [Cyanobacteria bacterium HKST-UBA02]|nr:PDZ domain-containing protein [Cyanobacteria bacterium HKST-UBA02]